MVLTSPPPAAAARRTVLSWGMRLTLCMGGATSSPSMPLCPCMQCLMTGALQDPTQNICIGKFV